MVGSAYPLASYVWVYVSEAHMGHAAVWLPRIFLSRCKWVYYVYLMGNCNGIVHRGRVMHAAADFAHRTSNHPLETQTLTVSDISGQTRITVFALEHTIKRQLCSTKQQWQLILYSFSRRVLLHTFILHLMPFSEINRSGTKNKMSILIFVFVN